MPSEGAEKRNLPQLWRDLRGLPGYLRGVLVALAFVFVLSVGLVIVAAFGDSRWQDRTGPIGDTFGGLLGPILSTGAIIVTVWLAIVRQPGDERRASERDQAERIVAWVAETVPATEDTVPVQGVVLLNSGFSAAFDLDLILTMQPANRVGSDPEPQTLAANRQSVVPPGTWFIPFDPNDPSTGIQWRQPVPVVDGQVVKLRVGTRGERRSFDLRTHTREVVVDNDAAEPRPLSYYEVKATRFHHKGEVWWRDRRGELTTGDDAAPDAGWSEQVWGASATSPREQVAVRQLSTHDEVKKLVDKVIAQENVIKRAIPAVKRIRATQGGGGFRLFLDDTADLPNLYFAGYKKGDAHNAAGDFPSYAAGLFMDDDKTPAVRIGCGPKSQTGWRAKPASHWLGHWTEFLEELTQHTERALKESKSGSPEGPPSAAHESLSK